MLADIIYSSPSLLLWACGKVHFGIASNHWQYLFSQNSDASEKQQKELPHTAGLPPDTDVTACNEEYLSSEVGDIFRRLPRRLWRPLFAERSNTRRWRELLRGHGFSSENSELVITCSEHWTWWELRLVIEVWDRLYFLSNTFCTHLSIHSHSHYIYGWSRSSGSVLFDVQVQVSYMTVSLVICTVHPRDIPITNSLSTTGIQKSYEMNVSPSIKSATWEWSVHQKYCPDHREFDELCSNEIDKQTISLMRWKNKYTPSSRLELFLLFVWIPKVW